jgi:hypothetical protein
MRFFYHCSTLCNTKKLLGGGAAWDRFARIFAFHSTSKKVLADEKKSYLCTNLITQNYGNNSRTQNPHTSQNPHCAYIPAAACANV